MAPPSVQCTWPAQITSKARVCYVFCPADCGLILHCISIVIGCCYWFIVIVFLLLFMWHQQIENIMASLDAGLSEPHDNTNGLSFWPTSPTGPKMMTGPPASYATTNDHSTCVIDNIVFFFRASEQLVALRHFTLRQC